MLITKPIQSLYGGVSQQSEVMRNENQVEVMDNAHATVVDGLMKRPHTDFVAVLSSLAEHGALIHKVNRDGDEKYIMIITGNANEPIEIFTVDGVKCSVRYGTLDEDLTYTEKVLVKNYITSTGTTPPSSQFKLTTVADYTFVVNTKVTAAFTEDTAGGSIAGTVQTFADLPKDDDEVPPVEGDIYHIIGNDSSSFTGYFVIYTGDAWEETIEPGVLYKLYEDTMPHRLVRTGTNQFTLAPCLWSERRVGNDETQPQPNFIGRSINNIFFFRDRLGLLSADFIYMSRTARYFDMFIKTALDSLDDDPIEISAASTQVTQLKTVSTFSKDLLVFSDEQQFHFGSGGSAILTPKTAAFTPTTHFVIEPTSNPAAAGPNVYFACPKEQFTAIREYLVQPDSLMEDAADITSHVPEFIPRGHIQMATCSSLDMLFVHSDAEPSTVFVYKFFWVGTDKAQSAWYRWTFDGDILALVSMGATLYLIMDRNEITLEKVSLEKIRTGDLDFRVHLDHQISQYGTYTGEDTVFELPYTPLLFQGNLGGIDENTVLMVKSDNPPLSGETTPGNDDYTALLIHSNQEAWNSNFIDSSKHAHPIGHTTSSGVPHIEHRTTLPKFGLSSIYSQGGNKQLRVAASEVFTFGIQGFCIDMWFYIPSQTWLYNTQDTWGGQMGATDYSPMLCLAYKDDWWTNTFAFVINGKTHKLGFFKRNGGSLSFTLTEGVDVPEFPMNRWVHVALFREGNEWTITRDGVITAAKTDGFNIINTNESIFRFGSLSTYFGAGVVWKQYIDEIRISIGTSRYNRGLKIIGRQVFEPESYAYGSTPIYYDTSFVDSSFKEHAIIPIGDIKHHDLKKKFNQTAILCDGTGDMLAVEPHADWDFQDRPFTIDFQLNPDMDVAFNIMNYGDSWRITYTGTTVVFGYTVDGQSWLGLEWTISLQEDQWCHLAFVRSGTVMTFYSNGFSRGERNMADEIYSSPAATLIIGGETFGYTGAIEEIRISNIARWTKSFFPPYNGFTVDSLENQSGIYSGVNGGSPDGYIIDEEMPDYYALPMLNWFNMKMIDPITGHAIEGAQLSGKSVIIRGNYQDRPYIFGNVYGSIIQLTTPYMQGENGVPIVTGRLQLRNLTLTHKDTGYYELHITPKGRLTIVQRYTGGIIGEAYVDKVNIFDGIKKWTVMTQAYGSKIEIVSWDYRPFEIQSGAYQAMFHSHARF